MSDLVHELIYYHDSGCSVCPFENECIIAEAFSCAVYSLCTTLCVECEPDLIAISLLYMACQLNKFKVSSWVDKPDGYTGKWYTFFVNDASLDVIDCKLLAVCKLGSCFLLLIFAA